MSAKIYGVTGPVSMSNPSANDLHLNDLMIAELKEKGSFESAQATRKRVEVLSILQNLVQDFVYVVSKKKNMSDGMAADAGGKIFTFGSYRLGVYGPGSDIDTLVVVPKHVSRDDFFEVFEGILRKRPELGEITVVPDAFVPIIKMEFAGIPIDLIFSKLNIPRIPTDMILDDKNLLKNMDEKDMRCLNGTRVTDEILQLVPKPTVFKHALRCVKMWAQKRAVYANLFGFPGGVAWAMLVARICQLYPNAVSATIIEKFFKIYTKWNWPEPVLLKPIEDGPLQVRVWNPRLYPHDRQHRMPVITPAYPSMCATHNITSSTQKIIMKELQRGADLMEQIVLGEKIWADLFRRHTFFHDYKFYLCVVAATYSNDEDHLKWSGMIESKIRVLIQKLELVDGIRVAHPYVKDFKDSFYVEAQDVEKVISYCGSYQGEKHWTSLVRISKPGGASSFINCKNTLHLTKLFIGLDITLTKVEKNGIRRLDIQYPCSEFYNLCKGWQSYNNQINFIQIKNVRLFELLSDVFAEGESRPKKGSKKRKQDDKNKHIKRPKSIASSSDTPT